MYHVFADRGYLTVLGLRAVAQEYSPKQLIVVSLDARERLVDGIRVIRVHDFLRMLWDGEITAEL